MSASQSGPPSRPHCSTANKNPAQIMLASQTKRCTTAEVQADKQKAADTAATKKSLSAAERQAKINSTAEIEDQIRKEDIEEKKNAAHPDQSTGKKGPAGQGLASNAAVLGAPQPEPMTDSHGEAIEELLSLESKHAKKTGPTGGLPHDWRKLIVSQTARFWSSASTPANDKEEVLVTGEFDDDEDVEQLKAVRNSKLSVKVSHPVPVMKSTKDKFTYFNNSCQLKMSIQMRVKIQEVDIGTIKTDSKAVGAAVNYKKMPKACLPFPGGNLSQKALEKWNKVYI
ncbi:hypothetical protein H0H81_001454 [Sphagnurus paluster]|uniref:Uncharacterized protein n=1 Tax=Sphagnurus paluster TaxID=117069 RepID=A0A9P7K1Q2_9AGAR|nr:hypothetical protein H0H81_001454 [Sphagnurus paluster]